MQNRIGLMFIVVSAVLAGCGGGGVGRNGSDGGIFTLTDIDSGTTVAGNITLTGGNGAAGPDSAAQNSGNGGAGGPQPLRRLPGRCRLPCPGRFNHSMKIKLSPPT